MSRGFDFQAMADEFLASGNVLVADPKGLQLIDPTPERDVLIDGDVDPGTAFQTQQSVLVNGSLRGHEDRRCHLEAHRDLMITGDVSYSQLRAENIYINGCSRGNEVRAVREVHVGADLVASRLSVGSGPALQRHIQDLRRRLTRGESNKRLCERQRKQDEKNLDRTCQLTSLPLDLNLGNLIRHGDGRVEIYLDSVYRSLGDTSEKRLRTALNEFFAKGIMGALARTNRKYIANNPTRAKVFTQFLSKLRDLYNLVAKCDELGRAVERDRTKLQSLIADFPADHSGVMVLGKIVPPTIIDFELAELIDSDSVRATNARVEIESADGRGDLLLNISDTAGNRFSEASQSAAVKSVEIRAEAGRPTLFSASPELIT